MSSDLFSFSQLQWTASPTPLVDYWIERQLPGGNNWGVIGINKAITVGPNKQKRFDYLLRQPVALQLHFQLPCCGGER